MQDFLLYSQAYANIFAAIDKLSNSKNLSLQNF